MPRKTSIPFLALLFFAGCDTLGITTVCTDEPHPAIALLMLDLLTNTPPEAAGEIVVRDGAFADTVTLTSSQMAVGFLTALATERPGTYTVDVDVSGYAQWLIEDVCADQTDDGCHVDTQFVTALLQRVAE